MESIKGFIITLVTMLVLMSAIEIITPDNSIKKYLKFVLGLILVSVLISPVVSFFKIGENGIIGEIKKYSKDIEDTLTINDNSKIIENQQKAFKDNLDSNCNQLLRNEFQGRDFKSNIECMIDFDNMSYSIDKVQIGVKDGFINRIQNIEINIGDKSKEVINSQEEIENEDDIKNYLSKELKIPIEKIELYKLQ